MSKTSKPSQKHFLSDKGINKDGVFRDWLKFEKYKHYDLDMEAAVVGIILLQSDSMSQVRRFLQPDMFYSEFHQSIWKAAIFLFDAGFPIDIFTVTHHVYNNPDSYIQQMLNNGRNIGYEITILTNSVCNSSHLDYWAYLIREQYISRKLLILTTGGVIGDGVRGDLKTVQSEMETLLQYRVAEDDWVHISAILVKLWEHMMQVAGKDIIGLPFGFKMLDQITSGITPGLYYLGARPSVGKTALAIKFILNQASAGFPIGIISLETHGIKLAARLLSMVSRIDFWRIYRNRMDDEMSSLLYTYTGAAAQMPIWISDQPAVNLSDIRAKTYKLMKEGAKAIYIDYIQLVSPDDAGTREQEVAKLSRGLKLLSMQMNIPIIALAQLSRASEKREDKEPRLYDLRESGSLEQDADGVMLLHRPEKVGVDYDENNDSTAGKAKLIIAKWRDGETFDHPLVFSGDRMEFGEDEFAIQEKRGWKQSLNTHNLPLSPTKLQNRSSEYDDNPF